MSLSDQRVVAGTTKSKCARVSDRGSVTGPGAAPRREPPHRERSPRAASLRAASSLRSWVRGMSTRATIESTQQPMMYQLIPALDLVFSRMAAAMSGAGPPAMTDASW